MHGAIDEKNPLNSGLIFSKSPDSSSNYLTGYDLFGQQLKAGLAVLSAWRIGTFWENQARIQRVFLINRAVHR